ncbi:MAG: hypothetical protein U0Q18_31585 [Bryobacteraceae bacterium]
MMHTGPSKIAEAIVGLWVPPACREEVLGDLHERYRSPLQYAVDAVRTVPWVILSRIRRTTDPQMLLLQALVLYLSFLSVAWAFERAMLDAQWGLVRLAIPAAMIMLGSTLTDAYQRTERGSHSDVVKGPLIGAILAMLSQTLLWFGNSGLAVPRPMFLCGCTLSVLLSSVVRLLSAPAGRRFPEVNPAPESGEYRRKEDVMTTKRYIAVVCVFVAVSAVLFWAARKAEHPGAIYTYSQFLQQLSAGEVSSIVVSENHSGSVDATFTLKSGATARTVLPLDYGNALRVMRDNLVEIEIRDSSEPRVILAKSSPFLLVLGVWILMMIFKFPARFKHSD